MPFYKSFIWPLASRVLRAFGLRPSAVAPAALPCEDPPSGLF